MDADTNVGASESLADPSSRNETGLPLQVPFSVSSVLILLLGTQALPVARSSAALVCK
jgi:hypothetical protein